MGEGGHVDGCGALRPTRLESPLRIRPPVSLTGCRSTRWHATPERSQTRRTCHPNCCEVHVEPVLLDQTWKDRGIAAVASGVGISPTVETSTSTMPSIW